jgi:hypothetical protein
MSENERTVTAERLSGWSPRALARLAGAFEALEGLTYTFGQVIVLDKMFVTGNAAATAANILQREGLFRLGFASCLFGIGCHIAWLYLFYELFKPVGRRVSTFAAFVMLVGCAVQAVTTLLYLAPLLVLKGGGSLSGFTTEQAQALAMTLLRVNGLAFQIYLVFFGFWCFLIGCLIFRSTFMPRILGVLLAIAGVGWMLYVAPPFAASVFPVIAVASAISEFPLQLWLLIMGVNDQRWREQAAAAGER